MSQADVMSYLESHEKATFKEMAEFFGKSRSAISKNVSCLKNQGLVECKKMERIKGTGRGIYYWGLV